MTRPLTISGAAWLGIFAVALLWGASFMSIRVAVREVPVFTLVFFRVGGAAAALWLWVALARLPLPRSGRKWGALVVSAALNNVVPFTLITWGQQHLTSGLGAILNASTAIFSVLVAAALLHDERLTARKALGVGFGFAGVAVTMGAESLQSFDITSLAQLALLGAACSYALAGSWARIALRGVAPEVSAAGMLTFSTLMTLPLALWTDGVPHLAYSAGTVAAILYLALFASALAFIIYYRLVPVVGAGNFSLVTLLVAPIAIVLGAIFLGETLAPAAYAGFALIAMGLVIIDGRVQALVLRGRRTA